MWSFQTDFASSHCQCEWSFTHRPREDRLLCSVTEEQANKDNKYRRRWIKWNNDWTGCRLRFKAHTHWMKRKWKRLASERCNDASYCYDCGWYEIFFQSEIAFGFAFVFAFCLSVTRLYDLIMNHWRLTIRLHYCPIIVRTFPSVSLILCNFLLKQEGIPVGCAPPTLYRRGGSWCPGVCVGGLCLRVSVQEGLCQGDPIPSPCGQTDARENITLS